MLTFSAFNFSNTHHDRNSKVVKGLNLNFELVMLVFPFLIGHSLYGKISRNLKSLILQSLYF